MCWKAICAICGQTTIDSPVACSGYCGRTKGEVVGIPHNHCMTVGIVPRSLSANRGEPSVSRSYSAYEAPQPSRRPLSVNDHPDDTRGWELSNHLKNYGFYPHSIGRSGYQEIGVLVDPDTGEPIPPRARSPARNRQQKPYHARSDSRSGRDTRYEPSSRYGEADRSSSRTWLERDSRRRSPSPSGGLERDSRNRRRPQTRAYASSLRNGGGGGESESRVRNSSRNGRQGPSTPEGGDSGYYLRSSDSRGRSGGRRSHR